MEFKHIPIMLKDCLDGLDIKPNGIYVDATIGGAGHSSEILKKLKQGILIGIDKDDDALKSSKERLEKISQNFKLFKGDHTDIKNILSKNGVTEVDGILFDLGMSSYQIDNPERGFSYMADAPLDMRMDTTSNFSAYDVVNNYTEEDLIDILYRYGEESFAKIIAKNIIAKRRLSPIKTTGELSEIIKSSIPKKFQQNGNPCKKTFQALRIEVNGELINLEETMLDAISLLKKGGRLCVITFHSLEDRIVKNVFKTEATDCICSPKLPICVCNHHASIKLINKKPIVADNNEIEINSRSRSAKLRIVEKI